MRKEHSFAGLLMIRRNSRLKHAEMTKVMESHKKVTKIHRFFEMTKLLNKSIFFLVIFSISALFAQELSITISNSNIGLIRENRALSLQKGIQSYNLTDIPSDIIPSSVLIESANHSFEVLEQNYEYDLINSDKTLAKSLDKEIWVISPNDKPVSGRLLSFSDYNIMLLDETNQLTILNRNDKQKILLKDFAKDGKSFITKPTLVWKLKAEKSGNQQAHISYLSNGLNWRADYVALLNDDVSKIKLASWVTVTNNSGRAYKNAKLKLMAGEMNIVPQNDYRYRTKSAPRAVMAMTEETGFSEKSFFEYHLYSLGRKTDIGNQQIKQIQLFPETSAKIEKKYRINSYQSDKTSVVVILDNSKKNNLGIALPAGIIRLYKKDGDDLEFIGENRIKHTPKDEKIDIEIGKAFDIASERNVLSSKRPTKRSLSQEVSYKIRNHKKEAVDVEVFEQINQYQEVKLLNSNIKISEKTAKYLKFIVHVKADEEKELHFQYITNW